MGLFSSWFLSISIMSWLLPPLVFFNILALTIYGWKRGEEECLHILSLLFVFQYLIIVSRFPPFSPVIILRRLHK